MEEETFTSNLAPAPKVKRTPADFLLERQACSRRFNPESATVAQLVKHAERFGSECVLETAAELGYGVDALIRLADACDRADLTLLRKQRPTARLDKRPPAERRAKILLGITDEEELEAA